MLKHFSEQNKDTIWDYLSYLSSQSSVYSTRVNVSSLLNGINKLYLFATQTEMVFVSVDSERCGSNEYARDSFVSHDRKSYYISGVNRRVSPVWCLLECGRMMQNALKEEHLDVPMIHYVLLTDSHIINYDTMCMKWQNMNVTVIPNMDDLTYIHLLTNKDSHLPGATFLMAFLKKYCPEQVPLDEHESDGFSLNDPTFDSLFLNIESGDDEKVEDMTNKLSDLDTDDDDDDNDDDFDFDLDDLDDDDDEEEENENFPSGLITINQNNTVKVQVLKPMDNPHEELDKLIGCKGIKARIDELISLTQYNRMLCELMPHAKTHNISLHSIFTGKPGTGKTTVCKIYGALLKEAGVLSKGHVVVANRGSFIGNLWVDEEKMVRELIKMAQGGVLMIDEAYQLNSNNSNDPGKLVIPMFMDILSDESQRDIAVILCGYKKEMGQLLELNPGLNSRFPNTFDFPDFSYEELLAITLRRVNEYHYKFTRTGWAKYKSVLSNAYQMRDAQTWGNARFIANLLEHIYLRHAQRCVKLKNPSVSRLMAITTADIAPIEVATPKSRIGF